MKQRTLFIILGISVFCNLALASLVGYLSRNPVASGLEIPGAIGAPAPYPGGVSSQAVQPGRFSWRSFVSHADGQPDNFAVLAPAPGIRKAVTLFVYLHGLGGSCIEPFQFPGEKPVSQLIMEHYPDAALLSCSYRREASFGNDLAMADISQNIREMMQEYPVKQIVFIGCSMGGCTALTYASTAPKDIKDKITGVVSVESTGDLALLYEQCPHPDVKGAMARAFGGTPGEIPEVYRRKSFLNLVDSFPKAARVSVISAREDELVPPNLQRDIVESLRKKGWSAKLLEIDGGHGAPPPSVYLQSLEFVLTKGGPDV